jgi:hypothetical protein
VRRLPVVITVFVFVLIASRAEAQWRWFNGVGVAIGGGPLSIGGDVETPLTALIRPDVDRIGVADASVALYLGTRRWAVILPDVRAVSQWGSEDLATGTLTLGDRAITLEPRVRSFAAYVILAGAQVAVVSSGRLWVRGELGSGKASSHIETDDRHVVIDLSGDDGLALSGGAGLSIWRRPVGTNGFMTIDVEGHYLRITGTSLRMSLPSIRVGWRLQMSGMP